MVQRTKLQSTLLKCIGKQDSKGWKTEVSVTKSLLESCACVEDGVKDVALSH